MSGTSTTSFNIPDSEVSIPVTHPTSLSKDQILSFPAFRTWFRTLKQSLKLQQGESHPFHAAPYALRSIEIQAADIFSNNRLGFLKLKATVTNDQGAGLPGSIFMRGGSVAMLIVLTPRESDGAPGRREEYAILTLQPRIAAGSLGFVELPAGMIDDSGTFAGAAAKEIREETGLEISADELLDLTQLALGFPVETLRQGRPDEADGSAQEQLQAAVYPSPGGSDEFIPIFLARKALGRREIDDLKGKLTGLRDEGEKITLKIVRLDDVWKVAGRDAKTLAALALYQGLKGEGKI